MRTRTIAVLVWLLPTLSWAQGTLGAQGDITAVRAGNGLTGGAETGPATLNVACGPGLICDPDSISVDGMTVPYGSGTPNTLAMWVSDTNGDTLPDLGDSIITQSSTGITATSIGPLALTIAADSDNATEFDVGKFLLTQDGGVSKSLFGMTEADTHGSNSLVIGVSSTTTPAIYFATRNDGVEPTYSDAKLTILNGGNTGIGNPSPTHRLDVGGTFRATGDVTLGDNDADATTARGAIVISKTALDSEPTLYLNNDVQSWQLVVRGASGESLAFRDVTGGTDECTLTTAGVLNCVGGLQVNGANVTAFTSANVIPRGDGAGMVASAATDNGSVFAIQDRQVTMARSAGLPPVLSWKQTGQAEWQIYQNGGNDTFRFWNSVAAADSCTLTTAGVFNCVGGLQVNGTSVVTTANVSGTVNRVAKFTGTNTVGDSNVVDDGSWITHNIRTDISKGLSTKPVLALQVGEMRAIDSQTTGTYNTTAGAQTSTGMVLTVDTTRGAGANDLTNRALFLRASGAQNNYAMLVQGGFVGIGTLTPTNPLEVSGATRLNGQLNVTDNVTGGDDILVDTHTINGALTINTIGSTVASSPTAYTLSTNALTINRTGTFDTTAASRTSAGISVTVSSTRVAGANSLLNVAGAFSATGGQSNRAIETYEGDVRLNATSGNTTAHNNLTVEDNFTVVNGVATITKAVGTTFASLDTGTKANLVASDSTAFATGAGGGILFLGNRDSGAVPVGAGGIKAMKVNATDGNYSFDLVFGARQNGAAIAEGCRLYGDTKIWNCVGGLQVNGTSVVTTANVSGTTNTIAKFTGTNTVGDSQITDPNTGIVYVGLDTGTTTHALNIGRDTTLTTDVQNGYRVSTYSDGNVYIDAKMHTGDSLIHRLGTGAQSGAAVTWLTVNGSGQTTFSGAATFQNTITTNSDYVQGTSANFNLRTTHSTGNTYLKSGTAGGTLYLNNDVPGGVEIGAGGGTLTVYNNATLRGGDTQLKNATSNMIRWDNVGVGAPTFTTRSAGSKLVLYQNTDASNVDYAIGIESSTQWYSVPNSTNRFKWYGGTTNVMTLEGDGNLSVMHPLTVSANVTDYFGSTTSAFGLNLVGYADSHGSTGVFHNAYMNYEAGSQSDPALIARSTHASFGVRGMFMSYGPTGGIRFYASEAATTASAAFAETERMRIANDGAVTVYEGLNIGNASTDAHSLTGTITVNGSTGSENRVLAIIGGLPTWTNLGAAGGLNGSGTIERTTRFILNDTLGDGSMVDNGTDILGTAADDSFFAWDFSAQRLGFTKKSGFAPKLTYGSATTFAIAQSSGATIGASSTFTDRFTIDSSGVASIHTGVNAVVAAPAGTTLQINQVTGTANYVDIRGSSAVGVQFSRPSSSNNGGIYYGHTLSNSMAFIANNSTRVRILATGTMRLGDVTGSAVDSNSDVIEIGNTGAGQTASTQLIDMTHTGSFNTTSAALTNDGINLSITSTRSAGANNLTNRGLYLNVSGAQVNTAMEVNAGTTLIHDDATFGNDDLDVYDFAYNGPLGVNNYKGRYLEWTEEFMQLGGLKIQADGETIGSLFAYRGSGTNSGLDWVTGSRPGMANLNTGTTTGGFAGMSSSPNIDFSYGEWYVAGTVGIPQLAAQDSQESWQAFGFGDHASWTSGCWFFYDKHRRKHTAFTGAPAVADKWGVTCRTSAAAHTTLLLDGTTQGGIATVNSPVVGANWTTGSGIYRLEIVMTFASSAVFKINGTTVATITTNIPSGPSSTSIAVISAKTVGTSNHVFQIDQVQARVKMNFARSP